MGFLTGWTYRKKFTVDGTADGVQTNYQIKMLVYRSTGTADANNTVYIGTKCLASYNDIRFTRSDGTTLLDYWIESSDASLATIWVEFNSIPTAGADFYIYYGNVAAAAVSSGANTFLVFDDFERGNNGDAIGGSWTVESGAPTISTDHAFGGTRCAKFEGVAASNSRAYLTSAASANKAIRFFIWKEDATATALVVLHGNGVNRAQIYCNSAEDLLYNDGVERDTGDNITADDWEIIDLQNFDFTAGTYDIKLNNVYAQAAATMEASAGENGLIRVGNYDGSVGDDVYLDSILVRNFTANEPAPTSNAWKWEEESGKQNYVLIAFDSYPLANPQIWTDVTSRVRSINTRRGRQEQLDRIEAGDAILELYNLDGELWPENTGSAYSPNVGIGKQIKIAAVYSDTNYELFTGFIDSWQPGWLGTPDRGAIMTVRATDVLKQLALSEVTSAGYAQELSGTRIGNILDDMGDGAGWPSTLRDLDAGQSTIQASGALAAQNLLSHLYTVTDSEYGYVFQQGDGKVVFHDRHARLASPYTSAQSVFGDDAGEMKYAELELSFDDDLVKNDVTVTRSGGTAQNTNDAASIQSYNQRSNSRTSLLMTTDAEALAQAEYIVSRYKTPVMRVKAITIQPAKDAANLWPKVLGYEIATRITLRLDTASIDRDMHIEGIEHNYDALRGEWRTRWQLSDADLEQYFTLDVVGLAELSDDNRLAY